MNPAPTPAQVEATTFPPGRRGARYDEVEVDDFLSELVARMRAGTLQVDFVRSASFGTAKGLGRSGYAPEAVDLLLADVVAGFGADGRYPVPPAGEDVSAAARPGGSGGLRRLFGRRNG